MALHRVRVDRHNHHLKLVGAEEAATQHWDDSRQSLFKYYAAMKQAAKLKSEVPVHDVLVEDAYEAMEKAQAVEKAVFEEAETAALEASIETTDEDLMAMHIPVDEVATAEDSPESDTPENASQVAGNSDGEDASAAASGADVK